MSNDCLLLALFLVGSASPGLAQKVWVVDDDGGPGVDFTDVDPAVAAAAPGDVLLLKAGSYSDLVINGKPLSVIADSGAAPAVAGASVRNIAAGQYARLAGLTITSTTQAGLQIKVNPGMVWIEDCQVTGAEGDGVYATGGLHPEGYPGVQVLDSAAVSLARCVMTGGDGDDYAPLAVGMGWGGPALSVTGACKLGVFDCLLFGGQGGDVFDDDAAWDGGTGGACIEVAEGELVVVGCQLVSGGGGVGGEDFDPFIGYSCGTGGDAGDGIVETWPSQAIDLRVTGNSFMSGVPGPPYPGAGCGPGALGVEYALSGANLDLLSTFHYDLFITNPVREGWPVFVTINGPVGSTVFVALASNPQWTYFTTLDSLGLIDPVGYQLLPVGVTSGAGVATKTFPGPVGVPAGQAYDYFLQVVGIEPLGSVLSIGTPAGVSLLDGSL